MPELRVQTGAQKGQTFLLRPPGPVRIGRDLEADFPLFDRKASREHFRIEFCDEGYQISDLGSRGGTFVDEQRVSRAILSPGSRILAGSTAFVFALDPVQDPLVGRELGGYRVLERVGRGGMGIVYRARQVSLDRVVALKVLSDYFTRDAEFCRMFIREARAAAELSHPNIVRVYDVNMASGVLFYAMEYMAHGSVEDLCRARGPLSVHDAVRISLDAAMGLEYAEGAGIVHRDIKPANLMIHQSEVVKIGDLGIALHVREGQGSLASRTSSGSPPYMSPEQVEGRPVDARTDIYGLGASMHQMLTGKPPFHGRQLRDILQAHVREEPPDIQRIRTDVPPSLSQLVRAMLAKDPRGRPAGAAALRSALESIQTELSQERAATRPWIPPRYSRRFFIPAAAAAVFLLGLGLGNFLRRIRSEIRSRSARVDRIHRILEEGLDLLARGDIEGARRKYEEVVSFQGTPEDWDVLRRDIDSFRNALQAAESERGTGERGKQ